MAAASSTVSLRRLLVLLTALGLLPLALLGVWGLHLVSESQQREQEGYLLDLARALSSAVDAELDGSVAALNSMARMPAMTSGELRAFYEVARTQVAAQPEWLAAVLTDASGAVLFRTADPFGTQGVRIVDPDSLRLATERRTPVAGRVIRGQGGRFAFPVRIPVEDGAGRDYVLSAVIEPGRMLRVIERQKLPSSSVIAIMDSAGRVVARSKRQQQAVGAPPSPSLAELWQRARPEAVGETVTLEGDPVSSAVIRSRYGWSVAIGVPRAALAPASLHGIAFYASGLAASLLVCALVASLLAGRIVRSFRHLQRGTAALGAGQAVTVAPSRVTEIVQMQQSLQAAAVQRDAHEAERSQLLASLERALEDSRDASRVKDEFLAMLGHELRNPLSPIVASLDLMDMRNEASSQRERTIMRRQVNHLRRLVDDLLDVSRIASGKLQIELRPVNLAEVVRHVVASFPGRPVEATVPEAAWVMGDESRLTQVLNNLLSNAARFGKETTRVRLGVEGGAARLAVSDDGVGMDREMLERVFDPFFQAPQPLARHTGGLGLGLAIVRRIVELHGGTVSAHSEGPGKGSCFEVVLPLGVAATQEGKAADASPAQALDVLVVDDNLDAAGATAAVLAHLGHRVRIAGTAMKAVDEVRRQPPDVAILDIGLPDMDGYALAAILRAREPGLRLVALTGYGQRADVAQALGAGFDLHLTKPATLEDLQRALDAR
ncbi:ATP-binding protein [Massilia sp. BSC265]|uniref:hybrid sensor histidine kinase/response regulator n=1 Tax=Massilia sp. BSC265 TaxID=1549812 RepID=UPI0004E885DB|nr:ATP-binding protein [Massilia sp. BSC265]KFI08900.1 histidine kinase [Massilia sp. BSC265]